MDRPTTAEIREELHSTCGISHDKLYALASDLLERLEVAEATIKSISENPDFGSCMSVIKQRNEQIYDLEATIKAIEDELLRFEGHKPAHKLVKRLAVIIRESSNG